MYAVNKIMRNVGLTIRYVRKKKGITMYALAKDCNTTATTISSIETGRATEVKLSRILDICNALDISIEDLVSLCESKENFYYGE